MNSTSSLKKLPLGWLFFNYFYKSEIYHKKKFIKIIIYMMTYVTYLLIHSIRRCLGSVKNILLGNDNNKGWSPFNETRGIDYLSTMDTTFLFFYSIIMILCGAHVEKYPKSKTLSFCLFFSGMVTCMVGFAKSMNVHNIYYFVIMMGFSGCMQALGWPCVLGLIGCCFDRKRNGLALGIWSSNGSLGNVVGAFLAGHFALDNSWEYSFIVPGLIVSCFALIVLLFLYEDYNFKDEVVIKYKKLNLNVRPENNTVENEEVEVGKKITKYDEVVNSSSQTIENGSHIGFINAFRIPGVIEYSLSLFCLKLVSYTFLFWLPLYIKQNGVAGVNLTDELSNRLSAVFDIGGLIGAILIGLISDLTRTYSIICCSVQVIGMVNVLFYLFYGSLGLYYCIVLLFIIGLCINGPFSLVTTSITANLGQHDSIKGKKEAISTVSGIIDGFGSLGATFGPFVVSALAKHGWKYLIYGLVLFMAFGILILGRQIYQEIFSLLKRRDKAAGYIEPFLIN